MDKENGKGIIFGVLGILTLIIAIMGASLAYFTATARGDAEEVKVQASTVAISYVQGTNVEAEDLIPADFSVVKWAYERGIETENEIEVDKQCVDKDGFTVCGVFRFDIDNVQGVKDAIIEGTITTTTDASTQENKEFSNLKYTVFEVVKNDEGTVTSRTEINSGNHTAFAKTTDGSATTQLFNHSVVDTLTANQAKVDAGQTKHYELLIWLDELAENVATDTGEGAQDEEQGLAYTGTISVKVSGMSDRVTGQKGE